MSLANEVKELITQANALGRTNLAEHSIELDEQSSTCDIMSNIAKIPPSKYWNSVAGLYATSTFPENTELIVDIPKCYDLNRFIYGTKNLKKIKVSGNEDENLVVLTQAFQSSQNLEEIDFTDFCLKVGTINASSFGSSTKLKRILGEFDLSNVSETSVITITTPALEEIRFKEGTIPKNLSMTVCKNLSEDSRKSIVKGLATVETTQTLKLSAVVVDALTEEEKTMILRKNWSVM